MKSYIWLLLGGAAAAALAFFASGIDKISIRIVAIEIESLSLGTTKLLIKLGIKNPTKGSVTVTKVLGTIVSDTKQIGTIEATTLNKQVAAETETILSIPIKLSNGAALYTLFSHLAKNNKDLKITINYQITTNLGTISDSKESIIDIASIQDWFPNAGNTAVNSNTGPGGTGRAPKAGKQL